MTRCAPRGIVAVMHRLPARVQQKSEAINVPVNRVTKEMVELENATVSYNQT